MNKTKLIFALISSLFMSGVAYADDNNVCPAAYQAQVDTDFGSSINGTTTSAITTCISKRHHIRDVLNMSTNVLNPKSGINQTLNNANLILINYKSIYGINLGEDLQLSVVAHFQGGQFLLTDAAYIAGHPGATANPSGAIVASLIAQGVHVYMCQNTMHANGWKTADLIPGVEEVPAGVVALFDFAQNGWTVITP